MTGAQRWQRWFNDFARDHLRIRLERRRNELRARHNEGPDEYLSRRPPPLPLPRFRVHVGEEGSSKPRRRHRRTNKPPSGRPNNETDIYLAPKVFATMQDEWVGETEAIRRVTETLGQFEGWDNSEHPQYDARRAARNSARERVYRSLKRFRDYLGPAKAVVRFKDANNGWAITPEEAGGRAYEVIRGNTRAEGRFSP